MLLLRLPKGISEKMVNASEASPDATSHNPVSAYDVLLSQCGVKMLRRVSRRCALRATHTAHILSDAGMLEAPFGEAVRRPREAAGLTKSN